MTKKQKKALIKGAKNLLKAHAGEEGKGNNPEKLAKEAAVFVSSFGMSTEGALKCVEGRREQPGLFR